MSEPVLVAHSGFEEPPRRNLIAVWKGGCGGPNRIHVNGRVTVEGEKEEVLAFLRHVIDLVEKA